MPVRVRVEREKDHILLICKKKISIENSVLFAKMEAFAKWAKTPEAKKKAIEAAKSKAWKHFLAKFPNADKSEFEAQVCFEKDHTGKGEFYFKKGQGFSTSVFGSDSKYWSPEMKAAIGKPSAFPT